MTKEEFYTLAGVAFTPLEEFAARHDLHTKTATDHLCYKCGSQQEFETLRAMLEGESEYVHQAFISGRRIAYIKLKKPVETALGPAAFLELTDQKPNGTQRSGFDHIEMYPTGVSYEELVEHLQSRGEEVKKIVCPHHTTDEMTLVGGFLVKLEAEPLIEKIKREEM